MLSRAVCGLLLVACGSTQDPVEPEREPAPLDTRVEAEAEVVAEVETAAAAPGSSPSHESLASALVSSDAPAEGDCAMLVPNGGTLGSAFSDARASADTQNSTCDPMPGGFACETVFARHEGEEFFISIRYQTDSSGAVDFSTVQCTMAG